MEPEVAYGKVLRALRKQAGYSQEQLALDADLQRNYISLLERGANSASIKAARNRRCRTVLVLALEAGNVVVDQL